MTSHIEEPLRVSESQDLAPFFRRLERTVEMFVSSVAQRINDGKITRTELMGAMKREYEDQEKTLVSKDFQHTNCRVPAAADAPGRAASRQGTAEDDPASSFAEDRTRFKSDSYERIAKQQQEKRR